MKLYSLIALGLFFLGFSQVNAQDYQGGIGVRVGASSGISGKYFVQPEKAVEGIISLNNGGMLVTGLYQFQKPFHNSNLSLTSLSYYYGLGAHFGSFRDVSNVPNQNQAFNTFGVNGVFGLEYMITQVPFTVSLDVIPLWTSTPYTANSIFFDLGLSVRYYIE